MQRGRRAWLAGVCCNKRGPSLPSEQALNRLIKHGLPYPRSAQQQPQPLQMRPLPHLFSTVRLSSRVQVAHECSGEKVSKAWNV